MHDDIALHRQGPKRLDGRPIMIPVRCLFDSYPQFSTLNATNLLKFPFFLLASL
jgi:hypothetical protein